MIQRGRERQTVGRGETRRDSERGRETRRCLDRRTERWRVGEWHIEAQRYAERRSQTRRHPAHRVIPRETRRDRGTERLKGRCSEM